MHAYVHDKLVMDFSVCGGSIYLWKIGWSDTREGIYVVEILIRDRCLGNFSAVCAYYKAYKRVCSRFRSASGGSQSERASLLARRVASRSAIN